MKLFASLALLCLLGLSGYAFIQTNSREDLHKKILELRSELAKNEEELLSPSADDLAKYAEFIKQPNSGLIRLLPRELYDRRNEMTINGGGAYYSFFSLDHAYGYGSDIQLEQNKFSVGFAGADYGFIVTVKGASLQEMTLENPIAAAIAAYQPP